MSNPATHIQRAEAMAKTRPSRSQAVSTTADVDFTATMAPFANWLYVGGTGDVVLRMADDVNADPADSATWTKYQSVPAGTWIKGCITHLASTSHGTTATKIVAEQ